MAENSNQKRVNDLFDSRFNYMREKLADLSAKGPDACTIEDRQEFYRLIDNAKFALIRVSNFIDEKMQVSTSEKREIISSLNAEINKIAQDAEKLLGEVIEEDIEDLTEDTEQNIDEVIDGTISRNERANADEQEIKEDIDETFSQDERASASAGTSEDIEEDISEEFSRDEGASVDEKDIEEDINEAFSQDERAGTGEYDIEEDIDEENEREEDIEELIEGEISDDVLRESYEIEDIDVDLEVDGGSGSVDKSLEAESEPEVRGKEIGAKVDMATPKSQSLESLDTRLGSIVQLGENIQTNNKTDQQTTYSSSQASVDQSSLSSLNTKNSAQNNQQSLSLSSVYNSITEYFKDQGVKLPLGRSMREEAQKLVQKIRDLAGSDGETILRRAEASLNQFERIGFGSVQEQDFATGGRDLRVLKKQTFHAMMESYFLREAINRQILYPEPQNGPKSDNAIRAEKLIKRITQLDTARGNAEKYIDKEDRKFEQSVQSRLNRALSAPARLETTPKESEETTSIRFKK
jgi:hypothetical protein